MEASTHEAKPVLIYDGKCGFCKIWIEYWKRLTGEAIGYAPFQEAADWYPEIPRERFAEAVHLIHPTGEATSGAHAVFETLAYHPHRRWLLALYRRLPGFAPLTEAAYRFIARHRSFFYEATRLLFGREVKPLRYESVQWMFVKLLGAIYLIAFVSFGVQAAGLIGSHGVQPVGVYLARVSELVGSSGYRLAPTVFWLWSGDTAVQAVCAAGAVFAALAIAGVFWRAALIGCFALYLSLVTVSQEFLSYQWDYLLLETGFLAIFLGYSRTIIWLMRWLLFRLLFLSGAVKLLSGDPSWRHLTALTFHYQTQPIPTPLAWYAHQLPLWFQEASCALVFFIELLIPFLILLPRRARLFALPWLLGLQILILLTGNYAFFNLLAIALCVFLADDALLGRVLPASWVGLADREEKKYVAPRARRALAISLAIVIGVLSLPQVTAAVFGYAPAFARSLASIAAPYGITSSYGLFAVMTTQRPEIVIEGSNDGTEWREYEFRYKAGRLDRRPPWVAPHQPRLDWQMWFAALGSYRENVWFLNLLARILQGRTEVLQLLGRNPFPDHPPKFLRARVYEYRFTDYPTRQRTGAWWTRTLLGSYVPAVTIEDLAGLPLLQAERGAAVRAQ